MNRSTKKTTTKRINAKTTGRKAKRAPAKKAAAVKREFSISALREMVGKRGGISADKAREIRELIA